MTAMSDLRQDALAAYANDYLQKPFRFKELLTAVQQLVFCAAFLSGGFFTGEFSKKIPGGRVILKGGALSWLAS